MRLGANAIELVFYLCAGGKVLHRLCRRLRGAGQHEGNRLKQSQPGFGQLILSRQAQRGGSIAQQHVGALHRRERTVKGARDSFLHQALAQADPQIAGDDFDDVLGFERIGAAQQAFNDGQLLGGSAACLQGCEARFEIAEAQAIGRPFAGQHLLGHRAQVTVLPVDSFRLGRSAAGHVGHRLPQERPTHEQRLLLDARKGPTREEYRRSRCVIDA